MAFGIIIFWGIAASLFWDRLTGWTFSAIGLIIIWLFSLEVSTNNNNYNNNHANLTVIIKDKTATTYTATHKKLL